MDDWTGQLSSCCGAEIIHMDICSACKEHCCPEDAEDEN